MKRRSETVKRVGRSNIEVRRPSPRSLGYDADWERVAKHRRELDRYLCQTCLEQGLLTSATDVDHIIPLHVRIEWRLELGNTQVLCRTHHRRKTEQDKQLFGSSTASSLTAEQQTRRDTLRRLQEPPRGTGGESFIPGYAACTVAFPARAFPRNWVPGGRRP
ncbi:HNH endonuclease [Blastopirellula retiformator]|uniref:HNH endonuclease n=1 Tax=Blastopirellula retiformator TaxID=2527970 RepID=UPI0036F409C3